MRSIRCAWTCGNPTLNPPDASQRCAAQLPDGFLEGGEPVFREPWEAQAFALAVSLIQSGRIQWTEWAETLGEEIRRAEESGIPSDGSGYYQLWLNALESLADAHGMASTGELSALKVAWREAYERTPHGQPVSIDAGPG